MRSKSTRSLWVAAALVLAVCGTAEAGKSLLSDITVKPAFINPTLKQTVTLSLATRQNGAITVAVIDRDGYVVRTIAREQPVRKGPFALQWDGRDDAGNVVADEAWSFRIEFHSGDRHELYFPAAKQQAMLMIKPDYYDRQNATLAYTLPVAARVHSQAGSASPDGPQSTRGAVLKTVVNREPRPAGRVVESWNGMDESDTIRVSDLQSFVVAVAATPLPENSVITVGNRGRRFLDDAAHRRGPSLLSAGHAHHHVAHHAGLTALDDASPTLEILPVAPERGVVNGRWLLRRSDQSLQLNLGGPTAAGFSNHGGHVTFYVDGKPMKDIPSPRATSTTALLSLEGVGEGEHILAVNWHSERGPVAASALRFIVH